MGEKKKSQIYVVLKMLSKMQGLPVLGDQVLPAAQR